MSNKINGLFIDDENLRCGDRVGGVCGEGRRVGVREERKEEEEEKEEGEEDGDV